MKKIIILVALAVVLTFIPGTFARTKRYPSASPRPTAAVDTNDRITVLHLASVTVAVYATQQSVEYKITPATKITVNGQPAALNGLAVGMDVKITTLPNDPTSAVTIEATTVKK